MRRKMVVIVPSRGRPQNIARLLDAWHDTGAAASLLIAVDEDDPELKRYEQVVDHRCAMTVGPRRRLCGTLNHEAVKLADQFDIIGFCGDDHLPRSAYFDGHIANALAEMGTGIAYGNDLIQGANLPTAVFMTSDIVRTLGFMAPPCLVHFFLDDAWKDWANAIGRLSYLPHVVIEHLHPLANTAVKDDHYDEAWRNMGPDGVAYDLYKKSGEFSRDVARLNNLLKEGAIV